MSTYAISDLHGCLHEFDEMLERIAFSSYDEMYIIGDVCDRGNDSIALLQKIMKHDNMHLIFGNHDIWFHRHIQTLIDAKREGSEVPLSDDLRLWLDCNGGFATADAFMELDYPDCYDIKLYLENQVFYKELTLLGRKFLLVHAGLGSYCHKGVRLSAVPVSELIWPHIGLDDNPFDDVTMIVGHLPTFLYGPEYDGIIAHGKKKSILHIDCGCVFGHTLGCVRLDDMAEFYVPSRHRRI